MEFKVIRENSKYGNMKYKVEITDVQGTYHRWTKTHQEALELIQHEIFHREQIRQYIQR